MATIVVCDECGKSDKSATPVDWFVFRRADYRGESKTLCSLVCAKAHINQLESEENKAEIEQFEKDLNSK